MATHVHNSASIPLTDDVFCTLKLDEGAPWAASGASESCSICYDSHYSNEMVNLPDCSHSLCKACLMGHIQAKMGDMLYPIYCPMCAIDRSIKVEDKTQIDQHILEDFKSLFSGPGYEKFEELQLSLHAMSMQCPECKSEMKVAREDLDQVLLTCPVTACGAKWCRACHRVISSCTKAHKCKPDQRFRRLMRARRWKYCPGCQAPIQREQGCAHMTCRVLGCRTHFCYRCGGTIWKPGQRGDAYDAASTHNRWCRVVFVFGCPLQ